MRINKRKLLWLSVAIILLLSLVFAFAASKNTPTKAAAKPPVNFLVIMTDDQAMNSFNERVMPNTFRYLSNKNKGTNIPNGYAVPPLCCPARASFQTGQYPHNHGVVENQYGALKEKDNILSTWLNRQGYYTGMIGKYMNGYEPVMGATPAPGFDYWQALHGKPGYYDYQMSVNGAVRSYGSTDAEYSTSVITQNSLAFLNRAYANIRNNNKGFFLWTSYYAPHERHSDHPACGKYAPPLDSDWQKYEKDRVFFGDDFNEADMSDKPPEMQYKPLNDAAKAQLKVHVRCARAMVQEVDRGVAKLYQSLQAAGQLENTVIFYLADNGYFFGEHRKPKGKIMPYLPAMNIPMMARIPQKILGTTPSPVITQPVGTIDIAPTIMDIANAPSCSSLGVCRVMDGRSIFEIAGGNYSHWPAERELMLEVGGGCGTYRSIIQGKLQYTEWFEKTATGQCYVQDRELYDLQTDPEQLDDLSFTDPNTPRNRIYLDYYSKQMDQLERCSGIAGRDRQTSGLPFCG